MKTDLVPRAMLTFVVSLRAERTSTATLGVATLPNRQVLVRSEATIMA